MSLLVVLLILVTVWAVVENYWRRYYTERERAWRGIATDALADRVVMRRELNDRTHRRSRS